jgi:hypothetical protein
MRIISCEQGSDIWWEARRGVPTASRFNRILTPKGKLSAQADGLICDLIGELLSLIPPEGIENATTRAMRWGVETESEARAWYSLERGVDVQQVGFCISDDGKTGCSPDGLIGEDGGIEIKCPQAGTHVAYLLDGGLPADYAPQVHGSLITTGRKYWEFLSYSVGLPPLLIRVIPDDYTDALRKALDAFHTRYMEALDRIKGMETGRKP